MDQCTLGAVPNTLWSLEPVHRKKVFANGKSRFYRGALDFTCDSQGIVVRPPPQLFEEVTQASDCLKNYSAMGAEPGRCRRGKVESVLSSRSTRAEMGGSTAGRWSRWETF
jgi:hypothetical protein